MKQSEYTNKNIKPMTLTELAHLYNISNKTMLSWLRRAGIVKNKREGYLFTPKQIREIFEKLGEPDIS